MKKRISAFFLLALLVFTVFPVEAFADADPGLWIDGIKVEADTETVDFDYEKNTVTVTLNEKHFIYTHGEGVIYYIRGESLPKTLIIKLSGQNSLIPYIPTDSGIYTENADVEIRGDGKIWIENQATAVYVKKGNLTVSGGTVSATGKTGPLSEGIRVEDGNLTVKGGNLTASGVNYNIRVENGNFSVDGGIVDAPRSGAGIYVNKGNFKVSQGEITVEGESYGANIAGDMTVSGGKIHVIGAGSIFSFGIDVQGDMTVSGGEIYATGLNYGIVARGGLTTKGGTIDAGGRGIRSCGVCVSGDLTVAGGKISATGGASGVTVEEGSIIVSKGELTGASKGMSEYEEPLAGIVVLGDYFAMLENPEVETGNNYSLKISGGTVKGTVMKSEEHDTNGVFGKVIMTGGTLLAEVTEPEEPEFFKAGARAGEPANIALSDLPELRRTGYSWRAEKDGEFATRAFTEEDFGQLNNYFEVKFPEEAVPVYPSAPVHQIVPANEPAKEENPNTGAEAPAAGIIAAAALVAAALSAAKKKK